MSYKRLGNYIQQVNVRNRDSATEVLLGVSITKKLIPSIANIIGTDMSVYKIIEKRQFAYGTVTSRNGEKISIALSDQYDKALVSQIYVVFEVIDTDELLPEYLMMWFSRPEFDRYVRFHSHGSTRETFDWADMCEVELPIPTIEEQREIVAQYQSIANKIKVNEQICEKLEATAQALYKHWFVDFEFPNEEGNPYKSSKGKMVWNEELGKEIPEGWEVKRLGDISKIITKGTTPEKMSSLKNDYYSIPFIKGETINENHTLNIDKTSYINDNIHNTDLKRSIIYKHDILFSIAGTLGKYSIYEENHNANCNQAVAIIRSNKAKYIYWNFLANEHKEYFNFNIQQAVQANYSLDTVSNYRLLVAKDDDLVDFFTTKIYSPILNFRVQNQKIAQLQSLLLSRLGRKNLLI
ncbi:restriction endonuclease subunit S [Chryseobacterium sp.]|uniref:restriction endonuclease subunit S n=1 Tax=Chryseobacterium sp. TaxID=1871047 RepID=UPI00262113AC|nr:restriction endonuclease subunit S [Chryseobacterium sp.]